MFLGLRGRCVVIVDDSSSCDLGSLGSGSKGSPASRSRHVSEKQHHVAEEEEQVPRAPPRARRAPAAAAAAGDDSPATGNYKILVEQDGDHQMDLRQRQLVTMKRVELFLG